MNPPPNVGVKGLKVLLETLLPLPCEGLRPKRRGLCQGLQKQRFRLWAQRPLSWKHREPRGRFAPN